MKSVWKWIIAGTVILAIGLGVMITTLAVNGWAVDIEYEMQTYTAKDDNSYLEIDLGASTLKTEFYDGDSIEIYYPQSKRLRTKIDEQQGKLTYKSEPKWYVNFSGTTKLPETVIKMPKEKVLDLKIDLGAGTINLAGGVYGNVLIDVGAGKLNCQNIECNKLSFDISAGTVKLESIVCTTLVCDISAGTVKLESVECTNLVCDVSAGKLDISSVACPDIKADVSAGTVNLGISGIKSEYTILSDVSAGTCNVSSQIGSTDKKLDVDCSAGTINVKFILDGTK